MQCSLLVPYRGLEDLERRAAALDAAGMTRFDVHSPIVSTKLHKETLAQKRALKREYDPLGLLNPGKL